MATVSEKNDLLLVTFNNGKQISLSKPGKAVLAQALAADLTDPLGGVNVVLKQCMKSGDADVFNHTGYLHQMRKVISDIFGQVFCILEWNEGQAEVQFVDDKKCILRIPTRSEYSIAISQSKRNPLRYVETLVKNCWVSGDDQIKESVGHLLGITEVLDELTSASETELGN